MLRHLVWLVLFAFPVFADWDDDSNYDEEVDERPAYHDVPNSISYAGMTIDCHWGCGDFIEDPAMAEISSIFKKTIKKVFKFVSPLDPAESLLDCDRFFPWEADDDDWEVYNWPAANGLFQENCKSEIFSIATYPQFLETASALRRDVRFYHLDVYRKELNLYKSALSKLKKERRRGEYGYAQFDENGELEFFDWGTSTSRTKEISQLIENLSYQIDKIKENSTDFFPRNYEKERSRVEAAIQEIDTIFYNIFAYCLENHQAEGITFRAALEDFIAGDFDQAIEQIRRLIEIAEKRGLDDDLLSKLYFLKGGIQSEFCLYADAIVDLTAAIQKNPSMKEAYFERATAYFELGQFDRALQDYLASDMRSSFVQSPTQLGLGIGAGILEGAGESFVEFIPSMLSTARGLGSGLWAFSKDPVGASQELVNAAVQCIDYLRSRPMTEIVKDMVPELKELVQNYDQLADFQKGKLIGHVIGKYGMDIFLTKYAVIGVKAYRNLKKANQIMTLEALASAEKTQEILAAAGKRWTIREQALRSGNFKVHEGQQGKHLTNHPNYKQAIAQGKNPSIFEHKEPERLVREYAGTGIKETGEVPGMPGYKEIVDFGEFIGYAVDELSGEKIATNWGKIHYAKGGVHIVPTRPRG